MEKLTVLYKNKNIRIAVTVILAIFAAVSLVQGCKNAVMWSQDFQWDAAKALTLRINPYEESLAPSGALDRYGFDEYYLQMEANQFPSLLMLLIPYTFFPPLAARYAWLASNLIFTALIIILLRKTFLKEADGFTFTALVLLMIAGTPYRNQIGVGQHTLFSFCFFLLAVYLSEYTDFPEKDGKRGILRLVLTTLCLLISFFKYTLTAPLTLYFVYKKRWEEIIAAIFVHVGLTGAAAWWLKASFLDMIIEPLKVASTLSAEGGLDFGALLGGSPIAYLLALVVMFGLFMLMLRMPDGYGNTVIAVLILWSLIITYHRTYDFFVIIAVAGMFYETDTRIKTIVFYLITTLAVFFVLRIFSEALPSKIAVGILYYLFTANTTLLSFRLSRDKAKLSRKGEA